MKILDKVMKWYDYFMQGVWEDPSRNWRVAVVKTLSLSVRSFFNSQLWVRAAALTYNTILAIVPALALVFAVFRGFGFQNLLENQLHRYLPAQQEAITTGLKFVDSYLNQSSEGIFVGAGIIFLLWTLFSLMSNVEQAFNEAWSIREGRTIWRQLTDYTAIFFILPVMLICSSGINILMTTTIQNLLPEKILGFTVGWVLDLFSLGLIWLFFTGTYLLIPNTRVKFLNALIAGIFAGTAFMVLQWLFVSGQLYVSKYNAIYGSFSFLPLLLIWLQLVWLITLAGAVVCYAMQNIYNISFINKVENISIDYRERVALAVMAVIVNDFKKGTEAPTMSDIAHRYILPANLVSVVVGRLEHCGLIKRIIPTSSRTEPGLVPAFAINSISVEMVLQTLRNCGDNSFIPGFDKEFPEINKIMEKIRLDIDTHADSTLVSDLLQTT